MSQDAMQTLASTLGRLPSGLCILTAKQGERETGVLVSWVQQCSFEPPQLTVAVKKGRDVLAWLQPGATFTLNLIGEGQTNFLSHFGKGFALDQPAFTGLNVDRQGDDPPILSDSLGYLICRVSSLVSTGDHELLVGTIESGKLHQPEGKPYVHVRKNGLRY